MKYHFCLFIGTALFAFFNQAHAELIINGAKVVSTTTAAPVTGSYTSTSSFQGCLANLRSQAIASGVSGPSYDRYTQNLSPE